MKAILVFAMSVAVASAEISECVMTQNRTGSRIVDVSYKLTGEPALVTVTFETNGVALPADIVVPALYGEVNKIVQPAEVLRFEWNPRLTWPDQTNNVTCRLRAWNPSTPPYYMAIDLANKVKKNGYPVYYYPDEASVEGAPTNELYKTDRILLRWIEPTGEGGFTMGDDSVANASPAHTAYLPNGHWMSIYTITVAQWNRVMNDTANSFWYSYKQLDERADSMLPYTIHSQPIYTKARGASNSVTDSSFCGQLRLATGLQFDLPTEIQWEHACRAGTTGSAYIEPFTQANANRIARSSTNYSNTGKPAASRQQASQVGWYSPNEWGLYDMIGNVWEITRNRQDYSAGNQTDDGAETDSCTIRGDCTFSPWNKMLSAARELQPKTIANSGIGFRIVAPALQQ